jgi:hypothetical protein
MEFKRWLAQPTRRWELDLAFRNTSISIKPLSLWIKMSLDSQSITSEQSNEPGYSHAASSEKVLTFEG